MHSFNTILRRKIRLMIPQGRIILIGQQVDIMWLIPLGFTFQPSIIDHTGNTGPQATKFISFINKVSGIKVADGAAGAKKKLGR